MNEATSIGIVIGALIALFSLIAIINKPFKEQEAKVESLRQETRKSNDELIKSLNDLTSTMKLMNHTLGSFQDALRKQDDFNDEIEMEIDQLKSDFKDFKHECDKKQYYKVREPVE